MINISKLSFQYPQSSQLVLDDVSFQIEPGTLTLITGASGSGKSTLLRCINGLVPHFSGGTIKGNIDVFGSDPIAEGPEVLAAKIGFVFQEPEAQFVFDIVEDEIAFALENVGMPRVEMHTRVDEILTKMQITDIRRKKVHEISGGEKQMVAIASALVSRPKVLILDEPTSQLDPRSADEILQYIVSLKSNLGLTVLISEHRLERLLPYTDSIAYLTSENKLAFGTTQEILNEMAQVPPIIKIAKQLKLSPLPLTLEGFHPVTQTGKLTPKTATPEKPTYHANQLIELSQLSAKIGNKTVLSDITLKLFPGEILTLLGLNSAGKTTLLRAILGMIPSTGKKQLIDENMDEMNLTDIIQKIAYLPQNPNDLLFADSVIEELITTLSNHHLEIEAPKLSAFLAKFGLLDKQHQYPRDLSVGERQRTALAAITVHEPNIILLDEPTRGLDYLTKQNLAKLIKNWRDQGRGILLVTHDIEFAAGLADRVAILEDGKLKFTGSPQTAFTKFPTYRTQTAKLFPGADWITPNDVPF